MGTDLLVVEDDEDIRASVCETLERAGHDVVGVSNAGDALAHLDARGTAVSLVVLDWLLPGMPAIAFLDALARRPIDAATPILVLTAHDRVTPTCGVTAVLTKPMRPRTLVDTVERLLTLPPRPLPIVERTPSRSGPTSAATVVLQPSRRRTPDADADAGAPPQDELDP
jgi:DNA-binding response OmpR family regulator